MSASHRVGQVGRAPRLYEIRPEAGWALAIDSGASWPRVTVADLSGRIVVRHGSGCGHARPRR